MMVWVFFLTCAFAAGQLGRVPPAGRCPVLLQVLGQPEQVFPIQGKTTAGQHVFGAQTHQATLEFYAAKVKARESILEALIFFATQNLNANIFIENCFLMFLIILLHSSNFYKKQYHHCLVPALRIMSCFLYYLGCDFTLQWILLESDSKNAMVLGIYFNEVQFGYFILQPLYK